MDAVTLVLAALTAGAAAGTKDVASAAVSDAYAALKGLLVRSLRRDSQTGPTISPESLVAAHEGDPTTWEQPLRQALSRIDVARDPSLLAAANALLAAADPDGSVAGKYRVDLRGAQGVQVGDHGQMTVSFTAPDTRPF